MYVHQMVYIRTLGMATHTLGIFTVTSKVM